MALPVPGCMIHSEIFSRSLIAPSLTLSRLRGRVREGATAQVRCRVLAKCEPHQRGAVRRNAARNRAIDEFKLLLVEFQSHDGLIWHGRIPEAVRQSRSASAANFAADIVSDLPPGMQRSGSIEWLNSR